MHSCNDQTAVITGSQEPGRVIPLGADIQATPVITVTGQSLTAEDDESRL